MQKWTASDMPSQQGRVIVVTGANSGLGYESSLALARKGGQVIMASRDEAKGQQAVEKLKSQVPNAQVEFISLDLASLSSIQTFATNFKKRFDRLDILLNNAGLMAVPFGKTKDGFELQFGVNHLGHFALTGQLLNLLLTTPNSRVVTVSSGAHTYGRINFDDLDWKTKYSRYDAYGQSKFANVLFAFRLQRLLEAAGAKTISVAAHPGAAKTNLTTHATTNRLEGLLYAALNTIASQSVQMGALPQLYAATAPDVKGGEFYGPRFYIRGYPKLAKATPNAYNLETAQRLWEVSAQLTGVHYVFQVQPSVELNS